MIPKKKAKGKAKGHGKDLPRYRASRQYEKELKTAYAKILGLGLAEVVGKMKEMVRHPEDALLTS